MNEENATSDRRWTTRLARAFFLLGMLAAIVTLLARCARWHWLLDLLAHTPLQLLLVGTISTVGLLLLRRWRLTLLPAMVMLANGIVVVPYYLGPRFDNVESDLRLVCANVLRGDSDRSKLLEFLDATDPDVFVIVELDVACSAALVELKSRYPHVLVAAREDSFGIGVYSRLPLRDARVVTSGPAELPSLVAEIQVDQRSLQLIATHPVPPMSARNAESRNAHLAEIAELTNEFDAPRLLVGDLNVTSWSPFFRQLLLRTGLRDARRGFGLQPSWPDLPWPLRIPIDHTLVSPDLAVTDRFVGPPIGSDHRPVVIDLALPNPTGTEQPATPPTPVLPPSLQ